MNRNIVISMLLTVMLTISAYAFWNEFEVYLSVRQQWNKASKEADTLKQQQKQLLLQKPALDQLRRFDEQAKANGFTKAGWAFYPVTIDEPVTFPVAQEILNETAHCDAYHFKPSMLHIKKHGVQSDDGTKDKEGAGKDLLLTLKGSFVVRRNDR